MNVLTIPYKLSKQITEPFQAILCFEYLDVYFYFVATKSRDIPNRGLSCRTYSVFYLRDTFSSEIFITYYLDTLQPPILAQSIDTDFVNFQALCKAAKIRLTQKDRAKFCVASTCIYLAEHRVRNNRDIP